MFEQLTRDLARAHTSLSRLLMVVALPLLFAPSAAALPDIEAIVPPDVSSQRCDTGVDWTLNYVAHLLHLDIRTLARVKLVRGLSNVDICTLPEARLQRAITKASETKPDHPGEAATFRELQRQGSDGTVDPMGLSNAIAARDAMIAQANNAARSASGPISPDDAGINSSAWTSLGPGNIGGRIRSLATVPGSPLTLFAGSVGGGIWKTTDGGASWNPVTSFGATLSVSSIVITPSNPAVMYAATGEGIYNGDAIRGAGVFKTTNGGSSWYQLSSASPAASLDWLYVNRLSMHAVDPLILLAATNNGIYRTINGGTSWQKVTSSRVTDVKFDPTNSTRAVAGRTDGRIERSTDAGATFTNVLIPATATPPVGSWGRVEVAWAASSGRLYAAIQTAGSATQDGRIYTSTDGGASWIARGTPFHLAGQGWYNNAIWVDPTNESLLLVGGLDNHRSTDGGLNFVKVSRWYCAPLQSHADNHAIVAASNFDASTVRTVYWGNDGGVYKAINIDALISQTSSICPTADGWTSLNNGLAITQFYGVAASSAGAGAVYGGTQDNGSLKWAGTGTNWSTVFGGDGGAAAADPADANYLYGEYVFLAIHRATNGTSAQPICNGIADAYNNPSDPTFCGGTGEANFIAPFVLDPNNSSRLYGGAKRLWTTINAKAVTPTWSIARAQAIARTSGDSAYWAYISAIAVAAGNPDIVYVGQNDGRVFKSSNATTASPVWTELACAASSPAYPVYYRQVLRLLVEPTNSNIVYAGHGGYDTTNLWKLDSTTATTTCTSIGTALPPSPVRGIARHPAMASWLYAGTEVGLFASENLGATWKAASDGPANVSVEDLVWQNGNTLIAATHGRGMFKAVVGTAPACGFGVTPTPVAAPATGGTFTVDISAALASCAWNASSATAWISPVSSGGSGSARLSLTVAANAGGPRAATITVASTSVLVEQDGTALACGLDIDGDSAFTIANDGVLLLRYAMGFRGNSLTDGLTFAGNAIRKLPTDITTYLQGKQFDLDGDGALTSNDALIAARALRGLTGSALTNNTVTAARPRSPAQIQSIVAQCLK